MNAGKNLTDNDPTAKMRGVHTDARHRKCTSDWTICVHILPNGTRLLSRREHQGQGTTLSFAEAKYNYLAKAYSQVDIGG